MSCRAVWQEDGEEECWGKGWREVLLAGHGGRLWSVTSATRDGEMADRKDGKKDGREGGAEAGRLKS